MGQRTHSKTDR